jgi:hypothetical protein
MAALHSSRFVNVGREFGHTYHDLVADHGVLTIIPAPLTPAASCVPATTTRAPPFGVTNTCHWTRSLPTRFQTSRQGQL